MSTTNLSDSLQEYKEFAVRAAKELGYPRVVVASTYNAKNECQVQRLMTRARQTYIEKED